jgi:hypothetical protein
MTGTMHPRLRARQQQVELVRALAGDRDLLKDLAALELLADRVDGAVGSRLAAGMRDTCTRFRIALAGHPPTSRAGRTVRRHLPARIRELEADCHATAAALGGVEHDPGTPTAQPSSDAAATTVRGLRLVETAAS